MGLATAQSQEWHVTSAFDHLPEVSGIQIDGDTVYVTYETRQHDGELVGLKGNSRFTMVTGLQKPDGLAISLNSLVYTQEFGLAPVIELTDGISTHLFDANGAEEIDSTDDGDVYVVEDREQGRVLKFERSTRQVSILASGLEEAEGICAMETGDVYFTEKGKGEVYRIRQDTIELYLKGLSNPGYLYCDESTQSIWITEDRRNFGRLLRSRSAQDYSVIASGLKSPQSIAFHSADSFLLAEQGRDRILLFEKKAHPSLAFNWSNFSFSTP